MVAVAAYTDASIESTYIEPVHATHTISFQETVARASLSVVRVLITTGANRASATGFFIRDGLIVTANHAVEDYDEIIVTVNVIGISVPAKVVATDEENDLALLEVPMSAPYLSLGDSDNLQMGDLVFTVGHPLGLVDSLAVGYVSTIRRDTSAGKDFLQLYMAANPGNSGGPVIDESGRVVGVLARVILAKPMGHTGYSLAVKSSKVKDLLDKYNAPKPN